MPIRIVRRPKSPYWIIRGTLRGVRVEESTGTDNKKIAEEIRAKREAEILAQSIYGRRATATFAEAALSYLESGGNKRFLDRAIRHFGTTPLAKINQDAIDVGARRVYPYTSPATRNRQFYTPVSAVIKHAAKRGWCSQIVLERPAKPPGRMRWLTPEQADRLIEACGEHLRPLVIFLLYTGARIGEALWLDWRAMLTSSAATSRFRLIRATAAALRTTSRAASLCIRARGRRSPTCLTGKARSFAGRMACLTSGCATTRTTRPRGTVSGRRSPPLVGAQVSRISRRTVVVTLGRRGITRRTATCSRCNGSAAGSRLPW